MGRLTGDNLIVLFIQPRGLEALTGKLAAGVVGGWGPIHVAGTAHVEVHQPLDAPLEPRLRLDLVMSGLGADRTFVVKVPLLVAADVAGTPEALRLALDAEPDFAIEHDGSLLARLTVGAIRKHTKAGLAEAKLPLAFPIPLTILDPLVAGRAGTWHAQLELLPAAQSGAGIAIALRHGGAETPLGIPNPLHPEREVALAFNGAHLVARLNALARDETKRELPLGFKLERLSFEMDGDALVVGGLVQRRYGKSRWGATHIVIDGRVRVTYDRAKRDARVDVSGLDTVFQGGLAWAAALVAPALTTYVIDLVSRFVRGYGPKLLGLAIDSPLDVGEATLRGIFADFSAEFDGQARMALYDAAFIDGDLWLTGDVART